MLLAVSTVATAVLRRRRAVIHVSVTLVSLGRYVTLVLRDIVVSTVEHNVMVVALLTAQLACVLA